MRKIKVEPWKSLAPNKDGQQVEVKESILDVLITLLTNLKSEDMPRGIEYFRIFKNISDAIEVAEKTNELIFEEREYDFIKGLLEENVLPSWALNPNIFNAITDFLSLEKIELKKEWITIDW